MSGYLHAKDRNDLKNKEVFKKECDVFINAAIPIGEIVLPDKGCLISECFFYFGPILKQRCTKSFLSKIQGSNFSFKFLKYYRNLTIF